MEKYKDLHKGNDQNNKTECKEVTQAYIDVCTAVTLATKGRPEAFSAHNAFLEANTVVGTIERARRVKKWEKRGKFLHELCERAATIVQDHFPSPGGISDEMKEGIPSIMGGQPHSVPNTYLLVRDATFVHRWQCRREAHLFHNGLLHLAQLLFETGFRDLFQTPIAVLVSHQGSFFTVIWLCPLLSNVPANIPSLSLTRHALDCLKAFTFTPTQTQIPVFRGADGNSYIISPALVAGPPQHGKSDRSAHQRFERILMNSIHGNHDSVVKTCASHLAEAFLPFSTDSVENTLRIKLVPRLVHRGGLSMQNLHEVYTSPALKCPTERKTKELRRLLEHEMVVRTMRRFLEATLRTTSTPDYVTDEMRACESIDAVNTLLKQVMKNPKRWFQRELMPLLRSKFNCPDGFSISMDQSFTTVLMKRALAGLNMEYDENNTEVVGFSPAVTISYTAFVSPVFLSARVEQAQLDALGLLERAAFHTPASGARSLTVLILRYYTIAAMLNAEERLDKVIGLTNNVGQLWKKNAMTAVAFDWMMGYVIQLLPKSMALQNKDFFLIHARLLEQQSTEADRNVVVKRFYSMAKGNLIDQMEKHNKPLYQSFVDRIAMMMSNVGAEMTDNNEFIPKFIVDWMFDDLFPTVPFQLLHESTAMEKALHLVWKGPANLRHLYAGRCNVYLEKLVLEYYKSIGDVVDREENTAVEYGGIQLPKAVAEAAARQKALRGSANGRPRERVSFAAFGNLMDNVVEENTFDPNILADLLRPYLKEFSSLRRGINEHAVSLSLVFGLALLGARSIYYPERLHYLIGQYSDATDANEKATALQDLLLTAAAVFLLLCDEGSWDIGPAVRVQSLYAVKNSSDPPKEVLRVARVLHVAEKAVARIVELTRLRKLLGPLWPLINEEQTERMRLQTSALARGLGILRRAQNGQSEEFKYTDDDDYREMFEEIDGLTYGGDEHRDRIDELKSLMKEREEELDHLSAAEKEKLIKKRLHREAEAAGEEAKWRADQRRAHQWEQDFDQPPVDDPHTEQRKELQAELDRLRQDEPENKDAIVDAQREIAKIRPTKQQEKADVKNLGADTFVFTDDQMYRDMYDEARRLHTMPGNHEGAIDVILKQMRARANEADELDDEAKNGLRQARREELVEFDMVYQGKTTEMQTLVDDNPVRHATRIAELQEELTSIEEQRRYLAGERTLGSEYFEITDDPMYFEMQTKLRNYQAMADADLDNANDMLEKMRLRQVFLLEETSDEERDTMLHNRQRKLITLDQKSNFLARELTRLSAEGKVKNARKIAETRRDAEEVEAERAVLSSDMPLGPDHFEFTDDDDYRELNEGLNHLIGNGRRSMSHSDRGAYDEKVAAMQTLATKLLDLSGSAKIAFVEARKQRLLRRIKAMKLGKFDREKLKSDKKKRKEAEEARRRAALEEAERKRRAEAGEDDVEPIPEGDHEEDSGSGRGQSEERSVTSEFCGGARIGSASSRGRSAGVRPLSSELSQTARSGATMRQSVRSRSVVAFPGETQSPATPPMSPADKTPLRSSASRRSLAHSWRRASAVAFSKMSAHDLREKIAALEAEMKTYQDDDPVRHAQKIAELEYEITELKAQLERLQDMSDLSDDSDAEDANQVSKAAGRATTRGQEIAFLASDLANAEAELERLLADGVDPSDERVLELRARIADLRQRLAAAEMEMDDGFGGQLPEWSGAFEAGASQSSRGAHSYSLSPLASMDPTTKTTILTNRGVSLAKQDSTYAEVAETVKKLEAKKKNAVLMSDVVEVFTPRRESAQSTQSGHSLRSVDASSPIPKSPLPTARPSSSAAAEKPTTEEETATPQEPVQEPDQKPEEEPEPEKPTTDAASEGEGEMAKKETTSPGFDSGDRTTAPMSNEDMVALEHEITSCREKMAIRAQELGLEFVTVGELFAAVTQYEKTRVLNEEDEAPDTEAVLARAVLQAEARRVSFGQRSTSAETDRKSTYDGNVSPQSIMKQKMAGSRRRSTALSMIEKRSSIVPSQHDLLSASSARSSQAGGSDLIGREFTYMHDDVFRQLAMEARTAAQINAKYHFGQVVDTCDGMMRRADVLDDLPPVVKQTKYDQITAKDMWYMAQGIDPFTMQTPLDALKLPQTALITDPALKCLLTDFVTAIRNAPREKDVWLDILTKMALRCEAVDPEASRSPHPNSRADSNSPGGLRPPSTDSTMAGSLMNPGSRAVTSSTVGPQGQLTGLPPRYPQRTVNTEDRAKSASELVQELERLIAEDPLKNVKRIAELQKEIRIRKRREEESAKIIEEMERLAAKDPVKYAARIAALQEKLDLMDTSYEEYKFRRGGRRHRRHRREYLSSDESDSGSQSGSDNSDDDSNSADSDSDSDYYYSRRRGRRGNNARGGRRNRRDDSEERRRKKKGQRGGSDGFSRRGETPLDANAGGAVIAVQQSGADVEFMRVIQELRQETRQLRDHNMDLATQVDQLHDRLDFATTPVRSKSPYARPLGHNHFGNEVLVAGPNGAPVLAQAFQTAPMEHFTKSPNGRYSWTPERASTRTPVRGSQAAGDYDDHPRASSKSPSKRGSAYDRSTSDAGPAGLVQSDDDESAEAKMKYKYHLQIAPEDEEKARYVEDAEHVARGQMDVAAALEMSRMLLLFDFERVHFENTGVAPDGGRGPARKEMPDVALLADLAALERMEQRKRDALAREARHTMQQYVPYASEITRRHQLSAAEHARIMDMHKEFHDTLYDMLSVAMHPASTREMHRKILALDRSVSRSQVAALQQNETNNRLTLASEYFDEFQRMQDSEETNLCLAMAKTQLRERKGRDISSLAVEAAGGIPADQLRYPMRPPGSYNTATPVLQDTLGELKTVSPAHAELRVLPLGAPGSFQHHQQQQQRQQSASAAGAGGQLHSSNANGNGNGESRQSTDKLPPLFQAPQVRRVFVEPQQSIFPGIGPRVHSAPAKRVPFQHNLSPLRAAPPRLPPVAAELNKMVEKEGSSALEHPAVTQQGVVQPGLAKAIYQTATHTAEMTAETERLEKIKSTNRLEPLQNRPQSGAERSKTSLDAIRKEQEKAETIVRGVTMIQSYLQAILSGREQKAHNVELRSRAADALSVANERVTQSRCIGVWFNMARKSAMVKRLLHGTLQQHRRETYLRLLAFAAKEKKKSKAELFLTTKVLVRRRTERWATWVRFYVARLDEMASAAQANAPENFDF